MKKLTQKQLNIILNRHKRWIRNGKNGKQADLSNYDLSYMDFSDRKLSFINLSGSILIGANFTRTNLFRANLTRANLKWGNFKHTNFAGAILENVYVSDTEFKGAFLPEKYEHLRGSD